jgi:cyclohexanone monooxygenase
VEWIGDCIEAMRENGRSRIEAQAGAQDEWVGHVREVAGRTLFLSCNSWYLGANVPGKPRVFMPYVGCPPYRAICEDVANSGYRGFELR